jgi:NAD(P)-dependent dehydrogenase (short-subunit alcohol dehydrogenase family)
MASFDLTGKTALVTGGARGIGFATCERLVARGARVAVLDLDQEACDAAAARLGDGKAIGLAADVTDRAAMQQAVATVVDRLGGVDVVVANAGIAHKGATYRALGTETFDRVIDVNLMGVVRTVEAALPQIVARRGHVVVVASVYAFLNGIGTTPYAMAKAGVEQFGRALRVELAQHGAGASVAYFGFIDTEMVHKALDEDPIADRLLGQIPGPLLKRLPPSEAGAAIVRGIERRQPRIIRPRRWTAYSLLRGLINPPLDTAMVRDAKTQALLRELDDRAGEEQPTTA